MMTLQSSEHETALSRREHASAPPWLWFWAVTFIITLPGLVGIWSNAFAGLEMLRQGTQRLQALSPTYGRLNFLLYPSILLDVLPGLALLLGLFAALFPQLRARYVESKFRLVKPPDSNATLEEIVALLSTHAPGLGIKVNMVRSNPFIFVYPTNYRQANIALFSGFIKVWRSDRQAAEAVLLHEVAHYRRGDVLITGVGSFFETMIKSILLIYILLFILPIIIIIGEQNLRSQNELSKLGASITSTLPLQVAQILTLDVPTLLLISLQFLFTLLRYLVLPLAAVWTIELAADQYAMNQQRSFEGMRRGLSILSSNVRWWQWLLFRLSHPPHRLRVWLLMQPPWLALVILLLLYPTSYGIRLFMLHGSALAQYASIGSSIADMWQSSISNTLVYVATLFPVWIGLFIMVILWPIIARSWVKIFANERILVDKNNYIVYIVCACILGIVCVISYFL